MDILCLFLGKDADVSHSNTSSELNSLSRKIISATPFCLLGGLDSLVLRGGQ